MRSLGPSPAAATGPSLSAAATALTVLAVFGGVLTVYAATAAPTITWRNGGADSGDLASAVASMGIPHPPGYPTYMLLSWLWVRLPLGDDLAHRLTLLSATSAAAACALALWLASRLSRQAGIAGWPSLLGGSLAALLLAVTPLLWSQATVAEVYAPGLAATLVVATLLLAGPAGRLGAGRLAAAAFTGALGLGLLPQLSLAVPGSLAVLALGGTWRRLSWRGWLGVAGAGLLGLTVFAYLPWRAAADPAVNWLDPVEPARLWSLVSAEMYRYHFSSLTPAERLARVGESLGRLAAELTPFGVVALAAGGVSLARRVGPAARWLTALAALSVLFRANYPAEGNIVYLLPALAASAVGAGVGLAWLLQRSVGVAGLPATGLLTLGVLGMLAWRCLGVWPAVDVAADRTAEDFARATLGGLPPSALVVTDHDAATFSLWYRQALGDRPDVVVVDSRLLFRDWYQRQLARRYPDLNPAALRPGGLTALGRPVYLATGDPTQPGVGLAARPAP